MPKRARAMHEAAIRTPRENRFTGTNYSFTVTVPARGQYGNRLAKTRPIPTARTQKSSAKIAELPGCSVIGDGRISLRNTEKPPCPSVQKPFLESKLLIRNEYHKMSYRKLTYAHNWRQMHTYKVEDRLLFVSHSNGVNGKAEAPSSNSCGSVGTTVHCTKVELIKQ